MRHRITQGSAHWAPVWKGPGGNSFGFFRIQKTGPADAVLKERTTFTYKYGMGSTLRKFQLSARRRRVSWVSTPQAAGMAGDPARCVVFTLSIL